MTEKKKTRYPLDSDEAREDRFRAAMARRADREAAPLEQGGPFPAFEAVKKRAERLGVSPVDLFTRDSDELKRSPYPGPECLEPVEIEEYLLGELTKERADHINVCAGCGGLLAALVPDEPRARDLLAEVRAAALTAASLSPKRETVRRATRQVITSWSFVGGAVAATLILFTSFILWRLSRTYEPDAPTPTSLLSLESDATKMAADSLRTRFVDGDFPAQGNQSDTLRVSTVSRARNRAIYRASASGAPRAGTIVADLKPDSGELYWAPAQEPRSSEQRETRAHFLVGKVTTAAPDRLVIENTHGEKVRLKPQLGQPLPALGQQLVAVVEPDRQRVRAIYVLDEG